MQIALIDPYFLTSSSPPNWALGQLEAALLEQGHTVRIVDFQCGREKFGSLAAFRGREDLFISEAAEIADNSDLTYFTTSFGIPQKPTPILARIIQVLTRIGANRSKGPVFVGGAQVDYITAHGGNPFEIVGGSANLVSAFLPSDAQLMSCVASVQARRPLEMSSGIWRRHGGQASRIGATPAWPNEVLRRPEWRGWNLEKYPNYRAVLTSLGCRYGCSFCFESKQSFQPLDLGMLLGAYVESGITQLAIEDSTLFGAHTLEAVIRNLDRLDSSVRFTCYALVLEVCKASNSDLEQMRQLGLESVILGIETPDDQTLRTYRKSVTPARAKIAIDKLHAAGISAQGCMMVGIPGVDSNRTFQTFEYARGLELDVSRWHVFQPEFAAIPQDIQTPAPASLKNFALIDVSLPDHLLPELMKDAPIELLLEEHFLMRSIPHVKDIPDHLSQVRYAAGYTLFNLYQRILSELKGSQGSFNEEDYYGILDAQVSGPGNVRV
jgi:hypothetical protein